MASHKVFSGRLFKKYGVLSVAAVTAAMSLQAASAADFNWTGKGDGTTWSDSDNWDSVWTDDATSTAIFGAAATDTTITAANVTAGGIIFNANAIIGGSLGNGINAYTSTTPFNVTLANGVAATISATLTSTSGLSVSGPGTLTLTSVLPAGTASNGITAGPITVTDGATLVLTQPQTRIGTVNVTDSTLQLGSGASWGASNANSKLNLDSSTLVISGSGVTTPNFRAITVTNGVTINVQNTFSVSLFSIDQGANPGDLIKTGTGTLAIGNGGIGTSSAPFNGAFIVNQGTVTLQSDNFYTGGTIIRDGATLAFVNTPGTTPARLPVGGDVTLEGSGFLNIGSAGGNTYSPVIGNLSGDADSLIGRSNNGTSNLTIQGSGTFAGQIANTGGTSAVTNIIQDSNGMLMLSGTIGGTSGGRISGSTANANAVSITVNSGMLLISGNNNTYTGATTINGDHAALIVTNTAGSATGTGPVTLNGGILASMAGGGIISSVLTATSGSRISPGGSDVSALTLGGMILDSGAILDYNFDTNPNNVAFGDLIVITGDASKITLPDVTQPGVGGVLLNLDSDITDGTYQLISYTGADPIANFVDIINGTIGGGDIGTIMLGSGWDRLSGNITFDIVNRDSGVFLNIRSTTSGVPEPASLSLLGLGAAGLLARRRR